MEFIDLKAQMERIRKDLDQRIENVLGHARFIMGPEVLELEETLAKYTGSKYVLGCANGTDAMVIALRALGVGEGDAVFVPAFTFFATAEVVDLVGATPVFVDVLEDTFNMDPRDLLDKIEVVNAEGVLIPKAVIAVDLFGAAADFEMINQIAEEYELYVVEDGAQSFGGNYQGKMNMTHGIIGTTSFFPAKPLGCYGDGGAIFTDDKELYDVMKSLRVHGMGNHRYNNERIGYNSRLDTLQAAVLLSKMTIFEEEMEKRQEVAKFYAKYLPDEFVKPLHSRTDRSAWAQYTLKASSQERRDEVKEKLEQAGIPVMIYYPIPLHLQGAYEYLGHKEGDLPVSERLCKISFSLPFHAYVTEEQVKEIAKVLNEA